MALFTITRRILGSMLTPFKTSNNSSRPVRTFKGIRSIKCNALEKMKFYPMEAQWRLCAQSKDPGSPGLSKGGTISGVGIRKIDTTNERGYFPRTSKARIDQIKQMLRDKAMLKGSDDAGKPPK